MIASRNSIIIGCLGLLLLGISCTTLKLEVPSQFSEQSTRMKVKGLNGWPINEHVRFGNYKTSRIKRGWHSMSSYRSGDFGRRRAENTMLDIFGVSPEESESNEKDKFNFYIDHDDMNVRVFGWERKSTSSFGIRTTSGKGLLDLIGHTEESEYDFAATIIPSTPQFSEPWKMNVYKRYDRDTDTTRRFHFPWIEEKGYATDGKDSIYVRAFYVKNVERPNGKPGFMPVKVRSGYEFTWDGGVVCIIDVFGKAVWLYNDLQPSEKLLLAALSTAIMIRRVEDMN